MIERALATPGWMSESELTWLAEQAIRRSLIAEVGCWLGRSTLALALSTTGIVYAVDTWRGSKGQGHEPLLAGKPEGWLLDEFKRNTEGCLNLRMVPKASVEAAAELQDLRFDLIFIDASHAYEDVRADLLAWMPLLAAGGLLCGHDYNNGWPGVNQAVDELVPGSKIGAGTIWYRPS